MTQQKTTKISYLNGLRLKNAIIEASKRVECMKESINKINIFPIPDKDTGTNMSITLNQALVSILPRADKSISIMSSLFAEAALMGAQGYSGMILAYFFSGFAEAVKDKSRLSTQTFVAAMQKAKEKAFQSLAQPCQGTMLSVISDWANFLESAAPTTHDFVDLLSASLKKAKDSLARTSNTLPVLKKAGVVDAGALGFVHLLEGFEHLILQGTIERLKPPLSEMAASKAEIQTTAGIAAPMKKVGLVTDSSCDLPDQFVKENDVHVIPLKLVFSNKTYLDKVDITPSEFYEKLAHASGHPHTSQPAVADIKKVYEKVLPLYEKIVSIHLPAALSGTLQNIELTAKSIKENLNKITCLDGKNISGGLGLIVREIAYLIQQKLPFDQILERTKGFIDNTHLAISLPTLKYLVKGGRVSKQKGFIGNLLHLNPIISINSKGELYLAGKTIGSKAARKKTLELIVNKAKHYKRLKFCVAHAKALAKAEWYVNQLQQTFQITDEIPILEAAPVLGVHAGPGTAGIAFIGFND